MIPCLYKNSWILMIELASPRRILLQAILDRYLSQGEKIPFGVFLVRIDHEISILHVKFGGLGLGSRKEFFKLFFFDLVNFKFVEPHGGSFRQLCFTVNFAGNLLFFVDLLLEYRQIFLRLIFKVVDGLGFGYWGNLRDKLFIAQTDLFDKPVRNTLWGWFSSRFGLLAFVPIGVDFLQGLKCVPILSSFEYNRERDIVIFHLK